MRFRSFASRGRPLQVVFIAVLAFLLMPTIALAATEDQKKDAIERGLEWLASELTEVGATQGYWNEGDAYYDVAATGSALLAFQEEGYKAGSDVIINGTNYGDVVGRGLNWLMTTARPYAISNEPTGNPDGDGNGIGVKFNPATSGNHTRDTYLTGIVLPAIASSGDPNALVTTGALATRTDGSGAGGAWTYKDVVQNVTDWFAYGQADPGNPARGGWRYYADYGQSDNSTAQWGAIAGLYATKMGVNAPDFVKDELAYWTEYIQNGSSGGSGYDHPNSLVNESKTGGLLLEMEFAGDDTLGNPYDLTNPDLIAALGYLNTNWKDTASSWNGNFGHPYAMWAIYKGLEVTIGLDDTTYITNLNAQGTAALDLGDTWNWWEDYCEYLVTHQNGGGIGGTVAGWSGYSSWAKYMTTGWNINILAATEIPDDDPVVPEPTTVVLLGAGLASLAAYRRRRNRQA